MSRALPIDDLMAKCQRQKETIDGLMEANKTFQEQLSDNAATIEQLRRDMTALVHGLNMAQAAVWVAEQALEWIDDNNPSGQQLDDQTARWYAGEAAIRARGALESLRHTLRGDAPESPQNPANGVD